MARYHHARVLSARRQVNCCCTFISRKVSPIISIAAREKAERLSVSWNMDRFITYSDEVAISSSDHFVYPFYVTLQEAFPKFKTAVDCCEENRRFWVDMLRNRLQSSTETIGETKIAEKLIAIEAQNPKKKMIEMARARSWTSLLCGCNGRP